MSLFLGFVGAIQQMMPIRMRPCERANWKESKDQSAYPPADYFIYPRHLSMLNLLINLCADRTHVSEKSMCTAKLERFVLAVFFPFVHRHLTNESLSSTFLLFPHATKRMILNCDMIVPERICLVLFLRSFARSISNGNQFGSLELCRFNCNFIKWSEKRPNRKLKRVSICPLFCIHKNAIYVKTNRFSFTYVKVLEVYTHTCAQLHTNPNWMENGQKCSAIDLHCQYQLANWFHVAYF